MKFITRLYMITWYVIEELRRQFINDKELNFEIGKKIKDLQTDQIITECSSINIKNVGVIYYHPIKEEFFYQGEFPGSIFFGSVSFPMRRDFKSTLPVQIQNTLIEVWNLKVPYKLQYSYDSELKFFGK